MLIDGTTQPGFAGTPLIALSGLLSGSSAPLAISGREVSIRGLAMGRVAIVPTTDENLIAVLAGGGLTSQLSLRDSQSNILVQSEGVSPGSPNPVIDEHLAAGDYSLALDGGAGPGTFTLTTLLTPAATPFQPIPVGSGVDAIVAGDFNGDGRLDLAVANGGSLDTNGNPIPGTSSVSVLLGNGDGTFQPQITYAVGTDPLAIVAGDFTNNGRLDLAVANGGSFDTNGNPIPGTSSMSVLLGNGDGTFQPQVVYAVGSYPDAIAAGDFTGDGHVDLAVANQGSPPNYHGTVSILLGNSDGTFQPQVPYAVGSFPNAIVAGYFTGDGRTDLAVTNENDDTVSVLLGNGDGTFQPQVIYAVGTFPNALVAGDFTGNGRTDLAVANLGDNTVSVLLGNGDGTFQPQVTYSVGLSPDTLVVGDFTGDGRADLAVANQGDSFVSLLLGKGDGTFQPQVTYTVGESPDGIVAGDFTGDGRTDLAVANGDNTVSVLLGNGDGTFQMTQQSATGSNPYAVVTGDFNGDGRLDLATANAGTNTISILLGNNDGTFQTQKEFTVGLPPAETDGTLLPWPIEAISMVAGDFNGDGRLDLAVAGEGVAKSGKDIVPGNVSLLLGDGDGTFQSPMPVTAPEFLFPYSLVRGDFNGDGKLDLAFIDGGSTPFGGTVPASVDVLLGNGDGTFQAPHRYVVGGYPCDLVAGDFTGDGKLDLAFAYYNSNVISVMSGNGDGTFQPPEKIAVGTYVVSLAAGDFNDDHKLDLVAGGYNYDPVTNAVFYQVLPLLGNGDGIFQPGKASAVETYPQTLLAGDSNDDGKLDLVIGNSGNDLLYNAVSDQALLLLGNGDGTFQTTEQVVAGIHGGALAAGDFTGDGRLDLAAANIYSNDVSVAIGNGDGAFEDPGQLATTPRATPLLADVNSDGTNDVFVIDGAGDILYRQGIPGQPGTFEPPVTINPGAPSRDIAWVPDTNVGAVLASVDAQR